ncbi:NDP-sugar synthase [Metabacillus sp. KIGAM252]|uniref:NDP-sugar synthase n=1 Tax=Metabacillus flavus TaxID=2823519 RepID=A0ABS5LG04_9BACI|nr:NDP-sugar synthase [Metabacillus flavus]MBS2969692.1 NDP-sugar synthase [Metabacillus flavus]
MKAVILAGGMGTRLEPLTTRLPKPMVPLLNKPVLEYVIQYLKYHGINDILMALCWKSSIIEQHFGDGSNFGVEITYIKEKYPLGTAGCLKLGEHFLNEAFLVVSGDTICNFDLHAGIHAHKRSGCIGTVFAVRKIQTGDYGSMIAHPSGRIVEFMEKPYRTEVYSEYINAGMYIFEPELFHYISEDEPQDICKDILPILLGRGVQMYKAEGYWSDIGSHSEYRAAQFDLLCGINNLSPECLSYYDLKDMICLGEGTVIEQGTVLEGPVLIGRGTLIEKGCKIGPYAIIGDGSHIAAGSRIEESICWSHQQIHSCTHISGSVLGSCCEIKAFSELNNGSVLGENVVLEGENVVKEHVRVWPGTKVPKGTHLEDTFSAKYFAEKEVFYTKGRIDLSMEEGGTIKAVKLAQAFAAACGKTGVIAGSDGSALSSLVTNLFTDSLRSFGCPIYMEEDPVPPSALRYGCYKFHRMGVYAFSTDHVCSIMLFDGAGQILPSELEKSIELHYSKATLVSSKIAGTKTRLSGLAKEHNHFLETEEMGIKASSALKYGLEMDALSYRFYRDLMEEPFIVKLEPANFNKRLDLIFRLDEREQTLELKGAHGDLPITPSILNEIFHHRFELPEAETPVQLLSALLKGINKDPSLKDKLSLYSNAACQHVSCRSGYESRVLSRLISDEDFERIRLSEGVNIHHGEGNWTRIAALKNDAVLSIITMDQRPEEALKTNEVYTNKIKHFQK